MDCFLNQNLEKSTKSMRNIILFVLMKYTYSFIRNYLRGTKLSNHQKIKKLQYWENIIYEAICFDKGNPSIFYFHLLPVSNYSDNTGLMYKHWKGFNKHCSEMFRRAKVVNVKIVTKPLRKPIRKSEY